MRQVEISPDVAGLLGAEQCNRMRSAEWDQVVQCWDCSDWMQPGEPATVLVLDRGNGLRHVVHAHPACSSSEIRMLTEQELDARRASGPPADGTTDVQVVAVVWDTGRGTGYPALMVSYAEEILSPGPERTDMVVGTLLHLGWHLGTDLSEPPPAGPRGWRLRATVLAGERDGLVELVDDGRLATSATVALPRAWSTAVARTGLVAVFHGSRYLVDWETRGRAAVKRAARNGSLVGGVIPAELREV